MSSARTHMDLTAGAFQCSFRSCRPASAYSAKARPPEGDYRFCSLATGVRKSALGRRRPGDCGDCGERREMTRNDDALATHQRYTVRCLIDLGQRPERHVVNRRDRIASLARTAGNSNATAPQFATV